MTTLQASSLQTPINVLDKMLALNLNISLWSARKKLTFEDVNHIPNNDLPPQDLATLGSKKIAPPESLRVFSTLKARAVTMLDRYGIRFMSGWAIPEDLIEQVMDELTKIRDEFNTEKEKFLNEYDSVVKDWINKHSQWKEILQNSTDSPDYVRSRMAFTWQLYKVKSSFAKPNKQQQAIDTGLEKEVCGLGHTLFEDVVKTADETWRKVYEGKNSVTHKALSPLRALEQKLIGLSFIEPHVMPVANIINATLSRIPKRGNIMGADLITLQGLVWLMRDKDALISHAQKLMHGQDVDSILNTLIGTPKEEDLQMAAYIETGDITLCGDIQNIDDTPINSIPIIADSMGLW